MILPYASQSLIYDLSPWILGICRTWQGMTKAVIVPTRDVQRPYTSLQNPDSPPLKPTTPNHQKHAVFIVKGYAEDSSSVKGLCSQDM